MLERASAVACLIWGWFTGPFNASTCSGLDLRCQPNEVLLLELLNSQAEGDTLDKSIVFAARLPFQAFWLAYSCWPTSVHGRLRRQGRLSESVAAEEARYG